MKRDREDHVRALMDAVAKELKADIDFDVMSEIYIEEGWILLKASPSKYSDIREVQQWTKKNCGKFRCLGNKFLFESEKDASVFALFWC